MGETKGRVKERRTAMEFEFTDRYQALGISYPNPETMCNGQCEGTGWVPVFSKRDYTLKSRIKSAIKLKSIHVLFKKCDGWHFVKCPDCDGTGKRKEDSDGRDDNSTFGRNIT